MRNSVYLLTKCQSVKTLTLCSNGHEKRSLTYEVRECQLSCTSTIEPPQNLGLPNREPSSKISKQLQTNIIDFVDFTR